jgi:hypothetical protein
VILDGAVAFRMATHWVRQLLACDHVRELIRKHLFEQPVGSTFRLSIAYPWLRVMRLGSSTL